MKPTKKTPSLSDKQLRRALAGLREEVAAPPEFRAQLLKRLEREGLIQGAPQAAQPAAPVLNRLRAWLTAPRLAFAATAALGLALTLRFLPRPEATVAPVQPAGAGLAQPGAAQQAQAQAQPQALAHARPKTLHAPAQNLSTEVAVLGPKGESSPMPEAILDETRTAGEVAVGDAPVAAPLSSGRVGVDSGSAAGAASLPSTGAGVPLPASGNMSAAGVDPKPTVVVVEPTPSADGNPLQGDSQLRGNVIRVSRGDAAVLLYRVNSAGRVRAEIFDRLGRSVAVLKDAEQAPGLYELRWAGQAENGGLAPSGILVLDLKAPGYHAQHKLLLVK